jgi:hypothetical protein
MNPPSLVTDTHDNMIESNCSDCEYVDVMMMVMMMMMNYKKFLLRKVRKNTLLGFESVSMTVFCA